MFCLKILFGPLRSDQKSTARLSLVHAVGQALRSSRVKRCGVVSLAPAASSFAMYMLGWKFGCRNVSRLPSVVRVREEKRNPPQFVPRVGLSSGFPVRG